MFLPSTKEKALKLVQLLRSQWLMRSKDHLSEGMRRVQQQMFSGARIIWRVGLSASDSLTLTARSTSPHRIACLPAGSRCQRRRRPWRCRSQRAKGRNHRPARRWSAAGQQASWSCRRARSSVMSIINQQHSFKISPPPPSFCYTATHVDSRKSGGSSRENEECRGEHLDYLIGFRVVG